MRQLVEHSLQHSSAVDGLVLAEYLINESSVEHCRHNIIHNLANEIIIFPQNNFFVNLVCPLLLYRLSLESGVNDVNHLSTKVDEEDGEGPVGHDDDDGGQDHRRSL